MEGQHSHPAETHLLKRVCSTTVNTLTMTHTLKRLMSPKYLGWAPIYVTTRLKRPENDRIGF